MNDQDVSVLPDYYGGIDWGHRPQWVDNDITQEETP